MANGSRTVSTTCVMDCPDTCALDVTVTDGAIASIRAGQVHPTAKGFICSKVAHFSKRFYHESRLLHPMKRRGPKGSGDFERVSWDEAIREVSDRFAEIRRSVGRGSHLAVPLRGLERILFLRLRRRSLFRSAGCVATRYHPMRCPHDRSGARHVRPNAGSRFRGLSRSEIHSRLGRESPSV